MYPKVSAVNVDFLRKIKWDCRDPFKYFSFIKYDEENKIIIDIDEFVKQGSLDDFCKFLMVLSASFVDIHYMNKFLLGSLSHGIWIELHSHRNQQDGRNLINFMTRLRFLLDRYHVKVSVISSSHFEIESVLGLKSTIKAKYK